MRILATFFLILSAMNMTFAQDLGHLKETKPIVFHMSATAGITFHNTDQDIYNSQSNTSLGMTPAYFIQANPMLSIYGVSIPVYLFITSQRITINKPFNRFGMSLYYKWAKLHVGWRSLHFSQFTLAGQQINGIGSELTPGKFRFGIMYGRFNNAVTNFSTINNLNANTPIFKRKGLALKLGYGSARNYFEFSYLQAHDDSGSVSQTLRDSSTVLPAANQVLGLKGHFTIAKKLHLNMEIGGSYFTRNTGGDSLEINSNWTNVASFPPNISSQLALAAEAELAYQFKQGNIQVKYRRIDPDFKSMGAFYMQTDIAQYTLGLNLTMFHSKLHLNSNFGLQYNNLLKLKVAESKRTIGQIGVNIMPTQYIGVDLQYSNYGISQQIIPQYQDPAVLLHYDSIRISQVNQSFSISPHCLIKGDKMQHSVNLQGNFQKLKNLNTNPLAQDFSSISGSLTYAMIWIEARTTITNSFNYFDTRFAPGKSKTLGYNLGISKGFLADTAGTNAVFTAINLSLFGGYFANNDENGPIGNTFSLNPGLSVTLFRRHTIHLDANIIAQRNKLSKDINRNRFMMAVKYNFSF